jgi:hypothetical protein
VFSNLVKILLLGIFSVSKLKEFYLCSPTPTQCPPGRVLVESSVILFLYEITTEFILNATRASAQCPPGQSSIELFIDSVFSRTQQSSSMHSLHLLNALLTELYKTPQRFCLQLCPPLHNLISKVFNNLEIFS